MGALAGLPQRDDLLANIARLKNEAQVVFGGTGVDLIDADQAKGAFMAPLLLRCDTPMKAALIHEIEPFGPVSTLMPYDGIDQAVTLAGAGKGSLVCSLFSHDQTTVGAVVLGAASSHGRMMIVDRDSAADSTGHGAALPHLLHGGPGRAGGGEELGGFIGMKHYMQRTAIQAAPATLDMIEAL